MNLKNRIINLLIFCTSAFSAYFVLKSGAIGILKNCVKSVGLLTLLNILLMTMLIFLTLLKKENALLIKKVTLSFMYILLFYALHLVFAFNTLRLISSFAGPQEEFKFVETYTISKFASLEIIFGIDGFSVGLVLLTTFLFPLCLISFWGVKNVDAKRICLAYLILEGLTINVFLQLNLLMFYIFFESVLIPMVYIIGSFGSRERRVYAAYKFFFYTLAGSLITLVGIILMQRTLGTLNIIDLSKCITPAFFQIILWFFFFTAFAIKIPMFPLHNWLPEAHTEAPTEGSVVLAGIMLKLGAFGFLRTSLILFPIGCWYGSAFIYTLSVLAVVYISLVAIRQTDLKRIIAYSSVAHMGFVTAGLFSLKSMGMAGAYFIMISHGLVSSALFFCVGALYDRYHTRSIYYYSGLVQVMPIFSAFFCFFLLANAGLPGTSSFIGEFLVINSSFQVNKFLGFALSLNAPLVAVYSLWLFNRVCFGNLNVSYISSYVDLSRREIFVLLNLAIPVLLLGVFPNLLLQLVEQKVITIEINSAKTLIDCFYGYR